MIIYENNKRAFFEDVKRNLISQEIKNKMIEKGISGGAEGEINSWINSLNHMKNALDSEKISDEAYVAIEYKIPFSSKRIDFLICGEDENKRKNTVIIELKQWTKFSFSDKDDYVKTYVGGGNREVLHPSYQVYSYKYLLETFNSVFQEKKIKLHSLAYLHNMSKYFLDDIDEMKETIHRYVIDSPIYFQQDYDELQRKLEYLIGKGNGKEILYQIENGELKPSEKLIGVVGESLINNNKFMLVEDQKKVFENVKMKISQKDNIFIVNGNPGTGKSVVAINLLKAILEKNKLVQYVAPNASFKNSIKDALKKHAKGNKYKDSLSLLFSGSQKFYETPPNTFDWIIVDEAHRLKNKENMYRGENQIEDIIKASKNTIFFVDENQIIRTNDIGTNENIKKIATKLNKKIYFGEEYHLDIQFRCLGSQGYINALDNTLQIRDTANFYLNENDSYDIRICDSPQEMEELINKRVKEGFLNSKILAGYAWEWISKKVNSDIELEKEENHDIKIEEFDYSIPWNFNYVDSLWSEKSTGKRQAGCVHVTQGLEFDYAGVIIGDDISIDEENNIFAIYDNYYDKAGKNNYRGEGTLSLKEDNKELSKLIKNIYKILLSRGQKGTYIFIRNPKLREYFKKHIK